MTNCTHCKSPVTDGVNGTVSGPAPWEASDTPAQACCYKCENEQMDAAELEAVSRSIDAAQRAGRFDLV